MQQIWSATGRRKRATAQVRIASPGTGAIQINQVDAQVYLQGTVICRSSSRLSMHQGNRVHSSYRNCDLRRLKPMLGKRRHEQTKRKVSEHP